MLDVDFTPGKFLPASIPIERRTIWKRRKRKRRRRRRKGGNGGKVEAEK